MFFRPLQVCLQKRLSQFLRDTSVSGNSQEFLSGFCLSMRFLIHLSSLTLLPYHPREVSSESELKELIPLLSLPSYGLFFIQSPTSTLGSIAFVFNDCVFPTFCSVFCPPPPASDGASSRFHNGKWV